MSCTTILVGKKASYDGSTIIARDDDSGSGRYDPKKFVAIAPQEQPRHYRSVLSHVEIDLPDNPCRYSIVPNVLPNRGILAEAGVSERNVAMSATETIAVNERVLGADPLVVLQPADEANGKPETPGGIGEEDIITLVLPYVNTAREGVKRLAELLETYGTYESNGIIISDVDEIWYVETIGGHHWIARRVPDDKCAIIPNQLGIDYRFRRRLQRRARIHVQRRPDGIHRTPPSRPRGRHAGRHEQRPLQPARRVRHRHREGPYLQHASRLVHVPPA